MTTIERTVSLPRLHPAQRQVISQARRYNVVCCGRRWGKTTLGADRLIRAALAGQPAAWFSPTYRMLTEVWRFIRERLLPVTVRISESEHRIELVTGGVIEMWSLDNPDVARGRGYARLVVDEAAQVRGLGDAWQKVLRPTLIDHQGDAWFCSTPKGMNDFFTLWRAGQDGAEPDWASWQLPTATNPHIPPAEIAAAQRALSALAFAQEFLAEFIPEGAGVFRRVQEAATATPQERARSGHQYVMGVDWGKYDDFTVIAVIDLGAAPAPRPADPFTLARAGPPAPAPHVVPALVHLARFNRIDYALQAERLRALAERFSPTVIVAERNAMGEPVVELLLRDGLPVYPFTTTQATKAVIIERLALGFERGQLRILPDPDLLHELLAYAAERLPSGLLRYGAPAGGHDDMVMALALAYWAATGAGHPEAAPPLYDR